MEANQRCGTPPSRRLVRRRPAAESETLSKQAGETPAFGMRFILIALP
jgi:hypothetical protein